MVMAGGGGSRWVRGRCLGRGSTAAVYLSASTSGGEERCFAVKSAELSRSAPLQREQKVLSSLRSPHIVSCLGSEVTAEPDGRVLFNLFMEYVPGGDLSEVVKRHGGLDEHTMRLYTRGILDGLAYLHSRGIVHCDVKGHNVLVGADDRSVKLADLGCARWVDGGSDDRAVISGTPLYMAPEVARGEEQGPAADIWALGCTVIEMATGCPPWRDVEDPVAAIHRIAFSDEVPDFPCSVSDDARDFLGRCLTRDPRKRWSAEELLNHPFVKCCGCGEQATANSKGNSPKSTLDQDFWDAWPEEDDEEENETKPQMDNQPPEAAQERLWQLLGSRVSPPPLENGTWDESCWVNVRNGVASTSRGCLVSSEASSGERFEVPIGQDEPSTSSSAPAGRDAESSGYSDCSVVTVEGYLPSNFPPHVRLMSGGNIIPSRFMFSVNDGNYLG